MINIAHTLSGAFGRVFKGYLEVNGDQMRTVDVAIKTIKSRLKFADVYLS